MKTRSTIYLIAFLLLLASGVVFTIVSLRPVPPAVVTARITRNLETQLISIDQKAKQFLNDPAGFRPDLTPADNYSFFEYSNNRLINWSTNTFIPAAGSVSDPFSIRLLKSSNGYYLAKKWEKDAGHFLLAIVPLYHEFKIVNNYLNPAWNESIFPQQNITILEAASNEGEPIYVNRQCVFRIALLNNGIRYPATIQWVAVVTLLFSFVALTFFLFNFFFSKRNEESGFVFLLLFLIPLRILMVKLNLLHTLINSKIFDPKYFASSSYNASMGDLILNQLVILILCYYLFRNYYRFNVLKAMIRKQSSRTFLSVIAGVIVLFTTLYPFVVIQTIHHNSSIPLNISLSLHFDVLRVSAILSIIISWISSFLFAHVFIRLTIQRGKRMQTLFSFAVSVLLFVAINQYSGQKYLSSLIVGCSYFLILYFSSLYARIGKVSYAAFSYLFISIFCFSINSAYSIEFYDDEERAENQFRFANNFLIDRDYFGEYLLHESAQKIKDDLFIQKRMSSPFLGKDVIRQKVRQIFLPGYFNKYDIRILLFNSSGDPLDNHSTTTFSKLINLYDQDAFKTDYKEVYFINSPSNEITQRNLVIVPINKGRITAGYVIIELSMKRIIPENVYPELLVDNRFQQFYRTQDLSYALFSNNSIAFRSGDFNYEGIVTRDWIGNPALYSKGIDTLGYYHIAQEDDLGKVAVVSSKDPSVGYKLSNFSFLFVLGLSIILFFILMEGITRGFSGKKLFFAARIQLFLNLSFFIPLIIVSIVALSLISRSSQEQLNAEYLNKSKALGVQIASYLDSYGNGVDENQPVFENKLADLAQFAGLDANVYNLSGSLMATSQPLIFENGLISAYANPSALQKMKQGENLLIEKEKVGKLEYFVSYSILKSPVSGKLIGILEIPFFQSVSSLEKVQIVIFTNILNIFAAIFIVLLVLSYFVSKWLTFPLTFITTTLSKTSLTKTNQPIVWRTDDEIGLMVKEYNQMLRKLSESKVELEQVQRERAWREIAQQVAHEIKNPLTPMKLTLQQMERAVQAGAASPEKIEKALLALLAQVETLNAIASSFSTFAKMPEPVMQRIELVSLLKRIVNLHDQNKGITFNPEIRSVFVLGDEQLLGRTFANIILNALQAARAGVAAEVLITIAVVNQRCTISFSDNGRGIDVENAERVFVPHFSTKKSGSGLGLAIAKQGIEQVGGKIWFDTTVGEGTTFYVEFPVIS